jgi:glycosyltransferase involved in cell wall biosynthesis
MVNVSVIIPAYNEIRFIQKTLESVVGEADEIILSDNASTDGTSDICQSFANKYPEIKYTRQKENIGASNNYLFCLDQASGKYLRNMGAHDMISIGSNHSMSLILDKYSDVELVYPKYIISLNDDYSYSCFHTFSEFNNDLMSDSVFIRTKSFISNLKEWSMFFGLWRTEVYRKLICPRIFQSLCTDACVLFSTAVKGKMIPDERSIFFRMNPHDNAEDHKKRLLKAFFPSKTINPFFWYFATIAELYDSILETFGKDNNYLEELFDLILSKYISLFDSGLTLDNMPPIISGKEDFCKNLITIIQKNIKMENEKIDREKRKTNINIKKIIKYIIPYGLYKLLTLRKS